DQPEGDGREEDAHHGDGVGRGGEGRRPEGRGVGLGGAHRRPRSPAGGAGASASVVTGRASRSGPRAPTTSTSTNVPTSRSAGTRTIPSISGASRWLRATPGRST